MRIPATLSSCYLIDGQHVIGTQVLQYLFKIRALSANVFQTLGRVVCKTHWDIRMSIRHLPFLFVAAFAFATAGWNGEVVAQGAGRVGSETDLLRNNETRQQLGLSASQIEKLDEAIKGMSPGREFMDPFLKRLADAKDDETRKPIREEMKLATVKAIEENGVKALTILDSRQLKVLRSIYIQQAGGRALSNARIATELGLTDDQKKKLEDVAAQRTAASAALSFDATEDQKSAFKKEWEEKALAVLDDKQRATWAEQGSATAVAATPAASNAAPGVVAPPGDTATMNAGSGPPAGAEVVSSFGGASDSAEGDEVVEEFSFNFRFAPWDQVLQDFAAGAGYTLDLNVVPPGTFSHLDRKQYKANQAMDILNGYLQRKGFALVRKDGFLVCVNVDKGIPPNLIPDVEVDDLVKVENGIHTVGENEIVRMQMQLDRLDTGVMAQEVEQLLGSLGTMTAFTQTGSLIIADTGSNLRRIYNYIELSVKARKLDLVFKPYYLKNMDAEEAEFMLLSQFGMRQGVANVSAGAGRDSRGGPAPTPATAAALQVMSDARTNSLFVTGSPDQHALVEEIIKAIDVSEDPDGNPIGRMANTGPYLRVYKVAGRADQVAQSLNAMMPGVVVNEDGAAGTVHVFATAKQHEQVQEWVRAFSDGGGAAGSVAVIPLSKMDPLTAAATLRNLFISEGAAAPTVETDLYGNRIIVKGTATQIDQIKLVLKDLGEDGTGLKKKGEGGTIRRYSLRGRDPEEFFQYLEKEWMNKEKTSIRVVVPKKSGPIRDLRTPSDKPQPETQPGADRRNGPPAAEDSSTQFRSIRNDGRRESGYFTVSAQQEPASDEVATPVNPPGASSDAQSEIQIVLDGDELLLVSSDEAALDRLEEVMDYLQESIPFRTKWTVFYLQAADATEAADLLKQFIPSSTVASTSASSSSFSLGSMFSPLTDSVSSMTGLNSLGPNPQTLRIIPDVRSNSLFVTGPQALVEDAEIYLEVLDSNNIPESLREMQPRRIEVEHADVEDVATIVRDTFKPYMEPPEGRQQQNNPLAQMFGGGGGGGKGNEPTGVRMTLSVDKQSGALIVSSSEAIFGKVQSLVEELDESSKKSNRTVRVVQLKHSDAKMVQDSLTSLFPRITSAATKTTSSTTNSSSNSNNSQPSPQPATDPFQQMMRGGGSGRGGSTTPFGGGMSPFGGGISPFGGGGGFGRGGGASPFGGGISPFGGGRGGGGGGR